ncbi:hypothetical protein Ddye_010830 [Dipteronia dyeriana]|uniref:DUF4283 domain-containing protein n=1 Tax=Dipteronia dyeriana TaxID=168575 RepID=A0AAE0CP67_9ROSI|nr:hypothetical protein Ddye_010830 [Dipteronia dyeriana]
MERNRFWQRGPWHFGKSLIVLEKPEGSSDVSKLGFIKVEFWVQIHNIPIMCMNQRTAKWLAEQVGGVIEIPSESRECWGLGNPRAFSLEKAVEETFPDLVFFSEMKIRGSKADQIRKLLGWFAGGICVDSNGHIYAWVLIEDDFRWHFSGFYGEPIVRYRAFSWGLLRRLRNIDVFSRWCGGDFNELLSRNEKNGGPDKSFFGMSLFREVVDDCDLADLGFSGPSYTSNNKREGKDIVQERLNRFLADPS